MLHRERGMPERTLPADACCRPEISLYALPKEKRGMTSLILELISYSTVRLQISSFHPSWHSDIPMIFYDCTYSL